ncbi:MAG TPA: hypothetical protein VJP85_10105 [Candidatus Baltobacteraceae bacterium]|nr:hypothetical protein [Candidatus Baltobacteraceae bacterium]
MSAQRVRCIVTAAALFMTAAGPAFANTVTFGISVTKNATASLSLSTATFTWANIVDSTNTSLAADNNPASANVTGTMLTTYTSGSGQIVVASPANITGTSGGTLPINALQIECTGSAQTGQTFNASTPTALTASASTTCASYAAGYYTPISFRLLMFVDDSRFPADKYSSASGFSLVASAT